MYFRNPPALANPIPFITRGIVVLMFTLSAFTPYAGAQTWQAPQISIFPELTGNALLSALADAYRPNTIRNYDLSRDFMFTSVFNEDGVVVCLYTGYTMFISPDDPTPRQTANNNPVPFNTEHIYPQSKGAMDQPARSDIHHLQPTRADVNSSRGNSPFGFVANEQTTRWWRGDVSQTIMPAGDFETWSKTFGDVRFEPRDAVKGQVARAVFYFYMMYPDQANNADPFFFLGMMDDLRRFHSDHPIDSLEYHRTLIIADWQDHDGNPFILDTTLVRRAFFENFVPAVEEPEEYFVNFELASKTGYAPAPIQLAGRAWNLSNVLVGTSADDMKIGTKSARFRHGTDFGPAHMTMLEDLADGIGTVSFVYARSNFTNDRNPVAPRFVVEYTTDGDIADPVWIQMGDTTSLNGVDVFTEFSHVLNIPDPARIRIRTIDGTNGRRFNIDNILISKPEGLSTPDAGIGAPGELPSLPVLHPNYPNPFNPSTTFQFTLPETSSVSIGLYDLIGRRIDLITTGTYPAGNHTIGYDASHLAGGIYIYRLQAGTFTATRTLSLIK